MDYPAGGISLALLFGGWYRRGWNDVKRYFYFAVKRLVDSYVSLKGINADFGLSPRDCYRGMPFNCLAFLNSDLVAQQ
jgi:hypothetical protein